MKEAILNGALPAWVLTFLIHSTLLFTLAWSVERFALGRRMAFRETVWRIALFGALASASVQTLAEREPWLGRHAVRVPVATHRSQGEHEAALESVRIHPPVAVDNASSRALSPATTRSLTTHLGREAASAPSVRRGAAWLAALSARSWFLELAGASLALGFVLLPYLRVRRWLGKRQPVRGGAALRELERLAPRQRPRLTVSDRIMGPVTLGVLRPEVCLPRRALEQLDSTLLRAMLAHELAHLERRDPLWFALSDAVCRLLWFQPLLGRARARLVELAELACDQRAARRTGDPIALASCLAEVAGWLRGEPASSNLACAMARPDSKLQLRVRSLLEYAPEGPEVKRPAVAWIGGFAATLLASATLPGLALQSAPSSSELRAAQPSREKAEERATRSLSADDLRHARDELSAGLTTIEERITALRSRSLVAEEQLLLDHLSARSSRLRRRHAALEAALEPESRAGTPFQRPVNHR